MASRFWPASFYLGDINVRRDFGFAGDFVEAMRLIIQNDTPSDFVVGSGHARSIAEFCEAAFKVGGLDWTKFVMVDPSLLRKVDSHFTQADSSKLRLELGWRPKVDFRTLVDMMVQERIRLLKLSMASTERPLSIPCSVRITRLDSCCCRTDQRAVAWISDLTFLKRGPEWLVAAITPTL